MSARLLTVVLIGAAMLAAPAMGAPPLRSSATGASTSRSDRPVVTNDPTPAAAVGRPAGAVPEGTSRPLSTSGRWSWPLAPPPPVARVFSVGPFAWSRGHRGVDLQAASGQEVLAPSSGTVTLARSIVDRPVVVLTHPGGIRTTYEPVTTALTVGTVVSAGQVIGALESGGHCASCLHWGARRGLRYIDPLSLLGLTPPIVLMPFRPDR